MAGLLNKLRMMDKAPATKSEAPAETGLYRREAVFPLSTFGDQSYATPETLRTVFGCEFPAALRRKMCSFWTRRPQDCPAAWVR